ncbi:MAG: cytochrome c-type biogenesis protein CcmH [Candidatus Acidiferrales bacterium]
MRFRLKIARDRSGGAYMASSAMYAMNRSQTLHKACCVILLAVGMCAGRAMAAPAPSKAKPTLEQVGNQVYCMCGCVTTLNHCPHLPSECESRAGMQALILKDIKQGKDDKGILADLVDQNGVHVLASPPTAGFNLTVWVLPGIGLLVGLLIVLLLVRRWRARVSGSAPAPDDVPIDPKIVAAIEEEMQKIAATKD